MTGTAGFSLLAFALPCLPLLVAAGLYTPAVRAGALALAPWLPSTALPLFLLHGRTVELPWLLLGTRVGVDDLAVPLLLLAIVAWTLAGIHAQRVIEASEQPRFFLFWLLSWTGNLCVFLTLDAASFYAAYAMMSFSAYGLIVFYRGEEDYRAGRIYLIMTLMGEALILSGLFFLAGPPGNPAFETMTPAAELEQVRLAATLVAAGFAVKMGMIPLHMWLPLAHPQAPVPASAVLSGVMLKAGLIGWMRFLPLGADGFLGLGKIMLAVGLASAFFGAMVGLTQVRTKTVLAYSSISQMGLLGAMLGAALAFPDLSTGLLAVASLFALHHGLAKTTLFLSVDIANLNPGMARGLSWVPAMTLAGAPLSSGALAKVAMKGHWPDDLAILKPLLLLSSVATTLIMVHFLILLWQDSRGTRPRQTGITHWLLLLVAGICLPWATAAGMGSASLTQPFTPSYLMDSLWPVLMGLAIAWVARQMNLQRWRPSIPPGDLIALSLPRPVLPTRHTMGANARLGPDSARLRQWLAHSEEVLSRMPTSLLLWLALMGVLALLALVPS